MVWPVVPASGPLPIVKVTAWPGIGWRLPSRSVAVSPAAVPTGRLWVSGVSTRPALVPVPAAVQVEVTGFEASELPPARPTVACKVSVPVTVLV